MAVEQATVVIVEDNPSWIRLLSVRLGEIPSLVLSTLQETLDFLDACELGINDLAVLAFIVDGSLSEGDAAKNDGTKIIARIREIQKFEHVPVIGNSGRQALEKADFNLDKQSDALPQLKTWIHSRGVR